METTMRDRILQLFADEAQEACQDLRALVVSLGEVREQVEQQLGFPADVEASPAERITSQKRFAEVRAGCQRDLKRVLEKHSFLLLCIAPYADYRSWLNRIEAFLGQPYQLSWDDPSTAFEDVFGAIADLEAWIGLLDPEPGDHPQRRTIFLVHGHDQQAKKAVKYFLEGKGLKVVILGEEAGRGKTLIDKFQLHAAEARFAVVLLTGDDRGGPANDDSSLYKPRGRQNVIFELGFFRAALGPEHVCVLYDEGVEIPSDYQGVEYIPLADDNWEGRLLKELEAAGVPVGG